jgi:hypothetical protein
MAIGILHIIEYPPSGPWRAVRKPDPSWSEVESAIRQMEGDRFPHIDLFLEPDPAKDNVPDFELLGGKSAGYVVTARPEVGEFYYRDPAGRSEDVTVWTSDQGFSCPAFMVCTDAERVIVATRHFYETGQLLEDFPWSPEFG